MYTCHFAKWIFSALALAGIGATYTALVANAVTGLVVSATILANSAAAAAPVVFGNYALTALVTTGPITVNCTPDVLAYTSAIDGGTGSGATASARKLSFGLSTLNYTHRLAGSHAQIWGDAHNTPFKI